MRGEAGSDPADTPGPQSTPEAEALSQALVSRIVELIDAAGGVIGFDQFMQEVLYAPGLGYYMAGQARFGEAGDFVTAPELSPIFGQCLARQVAEVLNLLGGGRILELGAGSGLLADVLLGELERLGALPEEYCILELSADLRARQMNRLHGGCGRVRWLDRLPESGFDGVLIANEVIDAMPVQRFGVEREGRVFELGVGHRAGRLAWARRPAPAALADAVADIQAALGRRFAAGYVSEFNPLIGPWCRALADALGRGALLLVDYGYPRREYYHPQRREGTLICHYRHRAHTDPFLLPGLQDISAFVDFSALADAGAAAQLRVLGYTSQAHFLIACGLEEVLGRYREGSPREQLLAAAQAKRLTLPGEMGERFKVMALAKGLEAARLRGFGFVDQRARL